MPFVPFYLHFSTVSVSYSAIRILLHFYDTFPFRTLYIFLFKAIFIPFVSLRSSYSSLLLLFYSYSSPPLWQRGMSCNRYFFRRFSTAILRPSIFYFFSISFLDFFKRENRYTLGLALWFLGVEREWDEVIFFLLTALVEQLFACCS